MLDFYKEAPLRHTTISAQPKTPHPTHPLKMAFDFWGALTLIILIGFTLGISLKSKLKTEPPMSEEITPPNKPFGKATRKNGGYRLGTHG